MKKTSKLLSILLSIVLMVSAMPFANIVALAAKPTSTSVAYISQGNSFTAYMYYSSLQEAFDAACESDTYKQVNLYKDVTLTEPITVKTQSSSNVNIEFNGKTVYAPNGDAFDLELDFTVVFGLYSYFYNSTLGDDYAGAYGGINAKGDAIKASFLSDKNVHIYAGFYNSQDNACPFSVGDVQNEASSNQWIKVWYAGLIGCQADDLTSRVGIGGTASYSKQSFCVYTAELNQENALIVGRSDVHSYTTINKGVDEDGDIIVDHICINCDYVDAENDYPDCMIGDTPYYLFAEAVEACQPNSKSTITMLLDASYGLSVDVNQGKDITLDLNGHKLTYTAGYIIIKDGKLTVQNGTIDNKSNILFLIYGTKDKTATDYAVLNLDNTVINNKYSGGGTAVVIDIDEDKWLDGNKIDQRGQYGVKVNIANSSILSTTATTGLTINGQYANYNKDTTVRLNIDNSKIVAKYLALYLAGYGITNVNNSILQTDDVGVELRAGILNITGEETKVISTSTEDSSVIYYNGTSSTGTSMGICVSQHSTGHPTTLNVYDGEISGMTAVYEKTVVPSFDVKNPSPVSINIYGGRFSSTNTSNPQMFVAEDVEKFIYGGDYSNNPKAFVAKGYTIKGIDEDPYFYRVEKLNNEVSLSVNDNIKNNIYLDLNGYVDIDEEHNTINDISFEFEHINAPYDYSNTTKKQSLTSHDAVSTVTTNGTVQYVYNYKSNPAQICEPAIVKIYNKGVQVDELDCSMLVYCNNAIAIAEKENATPKQIANGLLSHRLKDYATAAQVEFNAYTTKVVDDQIVSNLANDGVYQEDVKDVKATDLTKKSSFVQNATGMKITSVSFMSLSESGVNFDFALEDGYSISDYDIELTQGIDGSNIVAQFEATKYRNIIEVSGIEASNLDEVFIVTITNKNDNTKTIITYSALDYARTVLASSKTSENLKQFARTLYLYNEAANSYFAM